MGAAIRAKVRSGAVSMAARTAPTITYISNQASYSNDCAVRDEEATGSNLATRRSKDPGRVAGVVLLVLSRRPGRRTCYGDADEMVKMAAGWVTTSGAGLTAVLTVRRRQRAGHGAAAAWAAQQTWPPWTGHETAGPHAGVQHAPAFRAADHGQVPR